MKIDMFFEPKAIENKWDEIKMNRAGPNPLTPSYSL